MARAIERIERDIQALEEAIQAIAKELQNAYANYLMTLGQTVRQQLNQATYYLCTQGYPESFLRLSLNQRQQLQKSVRKFGQQTAEQLQALMKSEQQEASQDEQNKEQREDKNNERDEENRKNDEDGTKEELRSKGGREQESDKEENPSLFASLPFSPPSPISALFSLSERSPVPLPPFPNSSNPIEILKWQHGLERAVQDKLKLVSRDANLLLQRSGILPKKLPEPILEAAAAAASEASAEVMPGPPNLLNLVIEVDGEQQSEEPNLTQIMALNLRLGEIEFNDVTLSSSRKQIRSILIQLNKLGQEYHKKQRERSIAQAEAAWRAIWSDEF
ncbi:primosomal protein [Scytonema sp. UIC 10036]|uniref:primosomal protein n=1 Tax=Scytonema sp. UIC 10036 TaxID=2304196 RepID=UPI0012DA421C|nr:primosomal protein [Scytonema sp. UIC 10036]MUG98285.1 primosomal protein [Scytonema sp. UIC 10036]